MTFGYAGQDHAGVLTDGGLAPILEINSKHNLRLPNSVLQIIQEDIREIPAGGVLELKPGGNHLMVMGLISHPQRGEHVKFSVRFAPGDQQIDVDVPVLLQEPK